MKKYTFFFVLFGVSVLFFILCVLFFFQQQSRMEESGGQLVKTGSFGDTLNTYVELQKEDLLNQQGYSSIVLYPPDELPDRGAMRWRVKNEQQYTEEHLAITRKIFVRYGLPSGDASVGNTCAVSSATTLLRYWLKSIDYAGVLETAARQKMIYSDGSVDFDALPSLIEAYGLKVTGRPAHYAGYRGYALTWDDLKKYTDQGYPVMVAVRAGQKGLLANRKSDINHMILVIHVGNKVRVVDPASPNDWDDVPTDRFRFAWEIEPTIGLGFIAYPGN